MKKSFSLMLVLSFLIISIFIINKVITSFEKNSNVRFEYSIGEDNLIIKSILDKLNKLKVDNINDYKKLNNFVFNYKYKNFKVNIRVVPLERKFNINHIISKGLMKNSYRDLFYNICDIYSINNCENLISSFEDFFNKSLKDLLIIEGKFYNKRQFNKFINYYSLKYNDKNIKNVPWLQIFNFNSNYVSCALLTPTIKKILNLSLNANCNEIYSVYNKEFLNNLGIITFNKKISLIKLIISYNYYGENNLTIIYNLNSKKVERIEKYILY